MQQSERRSSDLVRDLRRFSIWLSRDVTAIRGLTAKGTTWKIMKAAELALLFCQNDTDE